MRLLYSSDLHGNRKAYGALLERASRDDVDALVLGGDLCPRGGSTLGEWIAAQREFLESFLVPLFSPFKKKYPAKNIFAIMGNDDFRKNADVLEKAEKEGVLHFIHKKKAELGGGFFIAGYGFVNTTPFRLKDWEKKDLEGAKMPPQLSSETVRSVPEEKGTIAEDMEDIAALSDPRKTVYAIHAPPFNLFRPARRERCDTGFHREAFPPGDAARPHPRVSRDVGVVDGRPRDDSLRQCGQRVSETHLTLLRH